MPLDSTQGSLKERGVRLTRQRQILLELIDKTGEHLDAESLYQMAKEKDAKLNFELWHRAKERSKRALGRTARLLCALAGPLPGQTEDSW